MNWPHSQTVLLVDDNSDVREGFSVALEHHGYTVEGASNGTDALSKLEGGLRPSVIVLDLFMPVMSGYEFREAQLKVPSFATIPVIIYSGHTSAPENAAHLGANICLDKPVHTDDLVGAVRTLCPISTPPD